MSDRYEERHFTDGFNAVQERRQGLPSQKARTHDVALTEEQCRDLASQPKLTVADWTDLTGVGRGMFGMYQVSAECVEFRRWSDHDILQSPSSDQVDMARENASPALSFPCSPEELVTFVDQACIGGKHFELPESFRFAVAQLNGTPLIRVERRTDDLPAIEPPDSLRASITSPSDESGDVLIQAEEGPALPVDESFCDTPAREPSLRRGRNGREPIMKWVKCVAKELVRDGQSKDALAELIEQTADRHGYQSERGPLSKASILRILSDGKMSFRRGRRKGSVSGEKK